MKDLVEAQFIGSKNDIEKIKAIVGVDNVYVKEFIKEKSSLLDTVMRLENELRIVSDELDNLKSKTPVDIEKAIFQHEQDMPHNQPVPNMSTENIDMDRLIDIVRCEANNIAQQAIAVALNGLRFDISYNHSNQSGYYTQSNCTNSTV